MKILLLKVIDHEIAQCLMMRISFINYASFRTFTDMTVGAGMIVVKGIL